MNSIVDGIYSLEVLVGRYNIEKTVYNNGYYFLVSNNSQYSLRLTNDGPNRTDAHLWINGNKVGIWRINPFSRVIISEGSNGRFVATDRTPNAPYSVWGKLDGLIEVRFISEDKPAIIGAQGHISPDRLINRQGCIDITDGTTPYDRSRRYCNVSTEEYEEMLYGPRKKIPYGHTRRGLLGNIGNNRYIMRERIGNAGNVGNEGHIMARIIADTDHVRSKRVEQLYKEATSPSNFPDPIWRKHPMRPIDEDKHEFPFTLSKPYIFDKY